MKFSTLPAICLCIFFCNTAFSQAEEKRKLSIKKTVAVIKIDGVLDEAAWKDAPIADKFICYQPTPFKPESPDNPSLVYFLYNNEGIYVAGKLHEKNKDSIASELIGRDGFGNNDFIGVVFDTYNDKINGFEYFVTPLGEQWDAKTTNGGEDFSWNAVWQSASKINNDGWSFEMFIPFSAIRFGKKKIQDWGLNLVRQRRKCGEKSFWQSLDPNKNGFLTQEGLLTGLEDIKPPLRLQFSPYLSTYMNHDGTALPGVKKTTGTINGGMDVKYGINQAFTLDMTLIPDFGQVQTDNRVLNLSPFELQFSENRTFFTEGTELFSKGNLFYSRRIGLEPSYYKGQYVDSNHKVVEEPLQAKIINATKLSGRTQKGFGVGILNAITQSQTMAIQSKVTGETARYETMPLTNYSIIVLDQTLKHNSSISLVNTNVLRDGPDRDANVTSALFNLNDKKNTWNVGGNISISNIVNNGSKATSGYAHSIYFGKTSGRFNFSIYQDLSDTKYDKSDLGYFTNNNSMDQGFWFGYNWLKPKNWYNQMRINFNGWYGRLVSPIDILKRKELMYQNLGGNINGNAQTKKLQGIGFSLNFGNRYNDFYEPRHYGRVFRNKGNVGFNVWYESNSARKFSWTANVFTGTGGVFKRTSLDYGVTGKIRFSNKFSVEHSFYLSNATNQPGWTKNLGLYRDTIIFSRRDVRNIENIFSTKYNFNNRMGITLRVRHSWTKVNPKQFYELDKYGDLQTPTKAFTENARVNYNFLSADLVYTWQFAQGSFLNIVWKDINETKSDEFEKNYSKNFQKTVNQPQFNSLSIKLIYFIDYLTAKKKLSRT